MEHLIPSARDYLALLKMTPLLGGRYEKIKKLGQGNFGEVWLVLDTEAVGAQRRYRGQDPLSQGRQRQVPQGGGHLARLDPHPGVAKLVDLSKMTVN